MVHRLAGELPSPGIESYVFKNQAGERFIFLIRQGRAKVAHYIGQQSVVPGNPYQFNDAVQMTYLMETQEPAVVASSVREAKAQLLQQLEDVLKPQ